MLKRLGTSALSEFRLQKLLSELQIVNDNINAISADYVHFIDLKKPLTSDAERTLDALLSYGNLESPSIEQNLEFIVTPRNGTISPWSTKATEIIRRCG